MHTNNGHIHINDSDIVEVSKMAVSAAEAARLLGINYKTYRSRAIKLGVFKTNQSLKGVSKKHSRKYYIDDNFFSNIDPIRAYFLGFIAADGSIVNNTLRIMIQARDMDILVRLLKEASSNYPIGYCRSHYTDNDGEIHYFDAAYIKITSNKIVADLSKYGIVQGKKYLDIDFLDYIPDNYKTEFILGLFDGDGSITNNDKVRVITIACNKNTCKSIENILSNLDIHYYIQRRNKINVIYISNLDGLVKFSNMYMRFSNKYTTLDRKRNKIAEFLNTIRQHEGVN